MTKLNVLLVTPFELVHVGGVSAAVASLGREFMRNGHDVTILAPAATNRVRAEGDFEGVPVYGIYLRAPFRERLARSVIGSILRFPRTMLELRRFLEERQIDVVAVQYPLPWMFYFGLLRRRARWKLVVTYQGSDAHDLSSWSRLDRRLTALLVANADCVTGVSRSLLEKVRQVVPSLSADRSRVIPNGAPLDRIGGGHGAADVPPDFVLGAGHLIHRKGFDTVIEAVGIAAERGTRLNLVIAGDGPDRPLLEALAETAGVTGQVTMAGSQSPEDMLAYFRQCQFFVLGSRAEGLPLVIAEAMGSGKAVVATAVDGVPDIVQDGVTGLLVPVNDASAMADAMIRLHNDPSLRAAFGAAGRKRAHAEYSWEAVGQRYLTLFADITSGSAA